MEDFFVRNPKFHLKEDLVQHPCVDLLEKFEFSKQHLSVTPMPTVKPFEPLSENEPVFVDKKQILICLLKKLRSERVIGVDPIVFCPFWGSLPRSSVGVRIISISTIDKNYMLDTRCIRRDLGLLNEIFLNPNIVKIFNKARDSLERLQQLFSLYFVNIFDLDTASRILVHNHDKPVSSFIRQNFGVKLTINKHIKFYKRPVNQRTKHYCTVRIHHYIYLYHFFKNKLIAENETLYRQFLEQCRKEPAKNMADDLIGLENELKQRHKNQMKILKHLKDWRSNLARRKNRRCESIVDDSALLQLAAQLPTSSQLIKQCCSSKLVAEHSYYLSQIIKDAVWVGRKVNKMNQFDIIRKRITSNIIQCKKPKADLAETTNLPTIPTGESNQKLEINAGRLVESVFGNNLIKAEIGFID